MFSSTITYTSISSDYEEPSDAGSPGVAIYRYDGLRMHPPEYLVPSDAEASIEDQPLPDDASPTTLLPGYIADSDLEDDPEEDPTNYHADGGDDADDKSSDDDDDNDDEEEEQKASKDNDEEDEHQAPADSSDVPVDDIVPLVEDTKAFETDESTPTPPTPPVARLLSLPTPPPSPLTSLSSSLPQIPSPPLPLPSPPTTSPTYAEAPLGYRATKIRFEIRESSSAGAARQARRTLAYTVDYGFIDTMDASIHAAESRAMTAVGVVNDRVTNLATTQRQDAQELCMHCKDAQDDRPLLGAHVYILRRERRYFSSMASSYEREAVISR
ncbi:hypothetical protein Tco_1443193 [Tanacetum coccineum]